MKITSLIAFDFTKFVLRKKQFGQFIYKKLKVFRFKKDVGNFRKNFQLWSFETVYSFFSRSSIILRFAVSRSVFLSLNFFSWRLLKTNKCDLCSTDWLNLLFSVIFPSLLFVFFLFPISLFLFPISPTLILLVFNYYVVLSIIMSYPLSQYLSATKKGVILFFSLFDFFYLSSSFSSCSLSPLSDKKYVFSIFRISPLSHLSAAQETSFDSTQRNTTKTWMFTWLSSKVNLPLLRRDRS